jgi:hypothetical protein
MAASISDATKPVLDFRNAKNDAQNSVTQSANESRTQQTLSGVAQGNELASNSIAILQGRGQSVNLSA